MATGTITAAGLETSTTGQEYLTITLKVAVAANEVSVSPNASAGRPSVTSAKKPLSIEGRACSVTIAAGEVTAIGIT